MAGLQQESIAAAVSASRRAVVVVSSMADLSAIPPTGGGHATDRELSGIGGFHLRRGITRTARISMGTLDLTATYTITLDDGTTPQAASHDAAAAGDATAGDVLAGIAAAIAGTSGTNAIAAAAYDADAAEVLITWRARVATGISAAATGTGVLAVDADPESATAILYSRLPATVARTNDTDADAAIVEAATAWEVVYLGASPLILSLADGLGWRDGMDVGGFAGFAWLAEDVAGHAQDGAAAGSVTPTYRAPAAYFARSTTAEGA